MNQVINQEVELSAVYFTGREMKTFPQRIQYEGRAITFASGLRYLIHKGTNAIKVFDMTAADGLTYRLKQVDNTWTLLGMRTEQEVSHA
jgi:hypothetical protein